MTSNRQRIKDLSLTGQGRDRIGRVLTEMPVHR